MDSKLFNAILAMDSYNRGYDAAIDLRPRDENNALILDQNGDPIASDTQGIQIGNATISLNSSERFQNLDQTIGFYALAYDVGEETIISYRGTDNLLGNFFFDSDMWNGYGTGAGSSTTNQAAMAFQFYNQVAEPTQDSSPEADPRTASIITTGHSLGGGLAGFVGAVYGKNGDLFDNMPFELAANDNMCVISQFYA